MPIVKLFANLRKLAGTKEISIPGTTVSEVLNELVTQSPSLASVLFDKEEPRPQVVVTLNGHNITDFETPVAEQDNVAVFPPIAGGSSIVGE